MNINENEPTKDDALRAQAEEQQIADELRDLDEARARDDRDRADARAREDRELADKRWREDDDLKRKRDAEDAERAESAKRPRDEAKNEGPSIVERIGAGVAAFVGAKVTGEVVKEPLAAKETPVEAKESNLSREDERKLERDRDEHDARMISGGPARGIGREGYLLLDSGSPTGSRTVEAPEAAPEITNDREARQKEVAMYAYRFGGEVPTIIEPVDGKLHAPADAKRVLVGDEKHAIWRNEDGELVAARESEIERAAKEIHDAILQAAQADKGGGGTLAMRMTHHE